jgi:hypothetical protein
MSEEITITDNLATEPVVEAVTPPVEEVVEAVETAEAESEEQARDDKGRFKGDGVQKRIDELTRARREAERQAEYWQGVATQTAPEAQGDKPSRDDYAEQADYIEALTEWKAEQAVTRVQREQAAQSANHARQSAWEAREAQTKASIPDYDAVVPVSTVPIKPHVVEALMDADAGPSLAYHLAKNPDVAARLNAMTPTRAAIELGRIETTLTAPAVKVPSNAPTPITPITPQASGRTVDLSKASMEDYIAERKRQGAVFR